MQLLSAAVFAEIAADSIMAPPRFFEAFKKNNREKIAYTQNNFKKRRVASGVVKKSSRPEPCKFFIGSSLLIQYLPGKAFNLVSKVNMF